MRFKLHKLYVNYCKRLCDYIASFLYNKLKLIWYTQIFTKMRGSRGIAFEFFKKICAS